MSANADLKVTTEILLKGASIFALIDLIFVAFRTKAIKPADFCNVKWRLAVFMALFFCVLFGVITSTIFW